MDLDLKNRVVIITGAASGIGRATAQLLHKEGANIALIDLSEEGLKETVSQWDNGYRLYPADLTDFSIIPKIIKDIAQDWGPIYGFVHCAGISSRKPLNVLRPEGFSKVMDVNFYAFEEFVRALMKRGNYIEGGKIVVMSSISSIRGFKAKTEYCVSKAAVDAFVRCMAVELAPKKICINSVMASEVLTSMAIKAKEMNLSDTEYQTPLGPSQPEEIANVIAFLLSNNLKTMTGSSVVVDGGALQV